MAQQLVQCQHCDSTRTARPDRSDHGNPLRLPLHRDGDGYCEGSMDKAGLHEEES